MNSSEVPIYNLEGDEIEKVDIGTIFSTPFRPDLIKRSVLASRRNRQIPYGTDPRGGKRTSAESWGVGRGAARIPRVKGSRTHSASRGALAPFTVGGRRTHPPSGLQNFTEKINKKEKILARKSAIAATANPVLVESRGHIIEEIKSLPLIVSDDLESLKKTHEVQTVFSNLGLSYDLAKAKRRKTQIRPGKGKSRGRKYKKGKSVLVVIARDYGVTAAARNLPGVDVVKVEQLNTEHLAPGTHAGRLTLWTKSAIEILRESISTKN
ncbi:MAG: 50S ribosomal protein L4 [Candidatus Heimdallarchaeota archaeon]|nr:MAG: 50S ribosomal protein L4 [Candidatus Heimdallarchaeota archaeon]